MSILLDSILEVGQIAASDLSKRHGAIKEGEKAGVEALPKIRAIVEKKNKKED
jgi:hypothetical protein